MTLFFRYVRLMVAVGFMTVNNPECSAVQDFAQLDHVNTKYVCQNDTITLRCPGPSLLEIQAASFGRAMAVICASDANADRRCDILDKKLIIKQICDYKTECTFVANSENFGNDCPDVDKYLNIIYACVRNPDMEYFKTKPAPNTLPTQPLTLNVTMLPSNVTQASNISMNSTTPSTQPWTPPSKPRKKPNVPKTKTRYFNPDGPALEFLSNGGQNLIVQANKLNHVIILCGLRTLTSLLYG